MLSDGEPGFFLCEQEVMQMTQCVWIRGEFIAQLFASLPCVCSHSPVANTGYWGCAGAGASLVTQRMLGTMDVSAQMSLPAYKGHMQLLRVLHSAV